MSNDIRAALERLVELDDAASVLGADHDMSDWFAAIAAARAALAAEPVGGGGDARCARIELVTAIHCLASHFEIACSGLSGDDLQKAKSDIAHAKSIAAKHNQNGPGCPQLSPATPPAPELGEVGDWYAALEEHLASEWPSLSMDFAAPAPPAPEPGEVGELVEFLQWNAKRHEPPGGLPEASAKFARAAILLQQQGAPAPVVDPNA